MGFPESRLAASRAGLAELRHVELTGSTNADLVAEARGGRADPVVLVADHQTAGRGRLDREWFDAGGALLVSFRFAARPEKAHEVMAAVAAAVRFGTAGQIRARVLVKWPNDLVVMSGGAMRKLAGLLAEWVDGPPSVVVVGVGLNVAAVDTDPPAASMEELGATVGRDRLLARIIDALPERLADPGLVRREIVAHSATVGRRVTIELPGPTRLVGRATELDREGRLVVVDDAGTRHVVSVGDVVRLRPAAPTS